MNHSNWFLNCFGFKNNDSRTNNYGLQASFQISVHVLDQRLEIAYTTKRLLLLLFTTFS